MTSPLSVVSLRWPARRSAEMSPLSPWTTTSASNGIARSMSALQRLTGPGVRARAAHGQRRAVDARVHDRLAPQPLQLLAHHHALGLGALEMDLPRAGPHDDALDVAVDRRRRGAVVLERLADADRDAAHDEQDAEDEQHEPWRRESHWRECAVERVSASRAAFRPSQVRAAAPAPRAVRSRAASVARHAPLRLPGGSRGAPRPTRARARTSSTRRSAWPARPARWPRRSRSCCATTAAS